MAEFQFQSCAGRTQMVNFGRGTTLPIFGQWNYLCDRWAAEGEYEDINEYRAKWTEWLNEGGYKPGTFDLNDDNQLTSRFTKNTTFKGVGQVMLQFTMQGNTVLIRVLNRAGDLPLGRLRFITEMVKAT